MRHRAQASTYDVMGCRRPGQEYERSALFFFIGLVQASGWKLIYLTF